MSEPGPGRPRAAELRRSIGEATDRIHGIIDAAEQAALEIRAEAVAEAERYLAEKRVEAELRITSNRASLEALTTVLDTSAQRLRSESRLIAEELERTVATLRESLDQLTPGDQPPAAKPAAPPEPEPAPAAETPEPGPRMPEPAEATPRMPEPPPAEAPGPDPRIPEPEPAEPAGRSVNGPASERPAPTTATAYPGTAATDDQGREEDQVEALLRATQMAVKGASRDEIAVLLRSEYGLADPDPILDEILGG